MEAKSYERLVLTLAKGIAFASREVIISGGAYSSPQLLKLSGIGPAAELAQHGIPTVIDLPGVGGNIQGRSAITINIFGRRSPRLTFFPAHRSIREFRHCQHPRALDRLRWLHFRGQRKRSLPGPVADTSEQHEQVRHEWPTSTHPSSLVRRARRQQ